MGVVRPIRRHILTLTTLGVAFACLPSVGGTQTSSASKAQTPDSSRCDSVVAAARVDSIPVGFFLSASRADGGDFSRSRATTLETVIGSSFVPPRPFRLTVFSGEVSTRFLRVARDSVNLHAPTVTGTYRVYLGKPAKITRVAVLRASLMPGFDTAAVSAIRASTSVDDVLAVPESDDSMAVDVSFSTDSVVGARRLATAWFPRMPVVDARPPSINVPLKVPEDAKQEGIENGDIVLRFVVDRQGEATPGTVELVRGRSLSLLKAAIAALASQHFTPATIRGCAVAQVVEYSFNFLSTEPPPKH